MDEAVVLSYFTELVVVDQDLDCIGAAVLLSYLAKTRPYVYVLNPPLLSV